MKRILRFLVLTIFSFSLPLVFSSCSLINKGYNVSNLLDFQKELSSPSSSQANYSLRELTQSHNLAMGAAVLIDSLQADQAYQRVLAQEFSSVTPENAMKFKALHPEPNHYTFEDADALVRFAQDNQMSIHGHTLVWHRSLPDWLTSSQWNSDELQAILKQHIQTVVTHFKGHVESWDVVNEAVKSDGRSLRDSIWLNTIGPQYIEQAFRWANEADPDAKLFYNDYKGEVLGPKADAIYELLKRLKQENVPVHGVGFQMHTSIQKPPDPDSLAANIQRFEDLGLLVRITEMDVSTQRPLTSETARLNRQAQVYSDVMAVCLDSRACDSFTVWGVADHLSWRRLMLEEDDAPLLFDEDYQPKPAHQALIELLQST